MTTVKINGIYYTTRFFHQLATSSFIHFEEKDLSEDEIKVIEIQQGLGFYTLKCVDDKITIHVKNENIQRILLKTDLSKGRIWN